MVLPLLTPVGSNFLKDWPAQNAVNCELIDEYAGPYAIQNYTPVLTASTTDPVLGTGTITGKYYRIFDQIFAWGEFRFGSGFSAGSGSYIVTLPFPAHTVIAPDTGAGKGPIIGSGQVWDESATAGRQAVVAQLRTASTLMFPIRINSGGARFSADGLNVPITWAVDDGINWNVRYKRAA